MSTEKSTPADNGTPPESAETEDLAQVVGKKLDALMENDTDEPDASTRYHEREGGFAYMVPNRSKDGEDEMVPKRFTNFVAEIKEVRRINSDFVNSDGIPEVENVFVLQGRLDTGRDLPTISLRAKEFYASKSIVAHWPGVSVDAFTNSGEEHMRAAILEKSQPLRFRDVRSHTGWTVIEEKPTYLHRGGGIDASGQNVKAETHLADRLRHVDLPDPLELGPELREAAKAVLRFLDVAPDRITIPLVAAVHRAVLGSLLPIAFAIFISGLTGTRKTSIAEVIQSFYGSSFIGNLPENWSSTENKIEKTIFEAKDMVVVVDDFKPGATSLAQREMGKKSQRVFQNAGNRVGRGRDTASGAERQTRYPRGLILATGEESPESESTVARLFLILVGLRDVDTEVLTEAQEAAASGLFSRYMSSYIHSVAGQYPTHEKTLKKTHQALLAKARREKLSHTRLPDTLASLALGWEQFADFIEGIGALAPSEVNALRERGWTALVEGVKLQGHAQREEQPAVLFMTYLRSAIASGRAHLAGPEGNAPLHAPAWGWRRDPRSEGEDVYYHPKGEWVGWMRPHDPDLVYLDPTATYSVVEGVARSHGGAFPVSKDALHRALDQAGLLAKKGKEHLTTTSRYCGQVKRVLCLKGSAFEATDPNPVTESSRTESATVGEFLDSAE